ncbi:hypothetical protein ACFL5S_01600 [Fibrobacterota bacterium]
MKIIPFPDNKRFAFTFTDDTDDATTSSVSTVYDFLDEIGIKATKTVWVFPNKRKSGNPEAFGKKCKGDTLQNPEYLKLIKDLERRGHEISLHLATGGNNLRDETIKAYEFFKNTFGHYPKVNINHGRNADNLYWCREAFQKGIFRVLAGLYSKDRSEGHIPNSPYFWGDICKKHTKYIRLFKTLHLNTLAANPSMPFHDPAKKYVARWFTNTDLSTSWLINKLLTIKNIERLIEKNGACIGYAYLHQFVERDREIDMTFLQHMTLLKQYSNSCWFTPVSSLLDRLEQIQKLKISESKREYRIINTCSAPITDIWITGNPNESIILENGYHKTFGASGVIHIESIPAEQNTKTTSTPQLKPYEMVRLVLNQILLLVIHHANGRAIKRSGW